MSRYLATFQPEAWVNDYAVAVDPEGETEWDCTTYALEHIDYLRKMAAEFWSNPGTICDCDDVFKFDPDAPEWVREWSGPFTITIQVLPDLDL